ncbi:MAG: hypothetical protein NVS2B4_09260 [Ramlibacter sp.]
MQLREKVMLMRFSIVPAAVFGAAVLVSAGAAHANGGVSWSVGVNTVNVGNVRPLYAAPVYVQPAPVYVQPAPVYAQPFYPQTIYTVPQVVYTQPQVVYPAGAVAYYGQPVYAAPIVVRPGYGHHRGHRYWD